MKRFLVFSGSNYYPQGGWGDFDRDFETQTAAERYAADLIAREVAEWAHCVDTVSGAKVYKHG